MRRWQIGGGPRALLPVALGVAYALALPFAQAQDIAPSPSDKPPSTQTPAQPPTPPGTTKPATPAQPAEPTPAAPTLQKETVTGGALSDTDARRFSTASKTVYGREELDRYGDTSLGDVLKRLPGVTFSGVPGRGGDIRMRGMGRGYTMILINGEPAPRGFSIESLSPDQVERIEVFRAPVAENTARAIAGTINIILREDLVKRDNEARFTIAHEKSGVFVPNVSVQKTDRIDRFGYNVTANTGFRERQLNESVRETTAVDMNTGRTVLHQLQQVRNENSYAYAGANAQLNWRLDGGDSLVMTPFFNVSRGRARNDAQLAQDIGNRPAPYATSHTDTQYESGHARVFGNWRQRFKDGTRLELRFNTGFFGNNHESDTLQRDPNGAVAHRIVTDGTIRDINGTQSGKWTKPIGQGHQFSAGWEAEISQRRESAHNFLDGVDTLAQYGDIDARSQRVALYAQDEWDVNPLWSMYGGLRWETIRTKSTSDITDVKNRSGVVSPLFHSVWKFDPDSKDQLRLAISRTYKAAALNQLSAIPRINPTYPVTELNTPTNADTVGNPALKPELAWGIDVTIEHYFEAGGVVSANVFRRSIEDLIRNVTTFEAVPWAPIQRWVSRPTNIGKATSTGIELEAKVRLDEVAATWPKVNVRVNYSRYWSQVDDVPGPNNRLAQQPPWTANIGADYRMTSLPLSFGGNVNFTPSYIVTEAEGQEFTQSRKRVADAYVLWRINPATQLRVSAANLYADDHRTGNREVFGPIDQRADTTARSYRFYSARLEVKF